MKASVRTLITACLFVLSAGATAMMVAVPAAELDAGADVIATGTVTGLASNWNPSNTAIYTDLTLAVDRLDKGTADRAVTVRVPGGEVGDVGMAVEDMPAFAVGDEVTLRLVRRGGVFELYGGMQAVTQELDAKPVAYYSYSGYHRDPASCNYHVNSTLPSDWVGAIRAGDEAWNAAGSAFRFGYLGTTGLSAGTYDGYNVVSRANLGSGGILAQNTYWYTRRGKLVLENDIVFNTYYPWATSGASGYYDVQNIGTHEMGHCLVLNDLYKTAQSEMTMYGYGAAGETKKRTLESGDIAGIQSIYGLGLDRPQPARPSVD